MTFAELRQKAGELAKQIQDHASNQAQWTDEDRSKWETLNKAYDDNAKELEAEQRKLTENEAVTKRLAEIEQRLKADRTHVTQTVDHQQRVMSDPESVRRADNETRAYAMQAWLRANNGMALEQRHVDACRALNVNPNQAHYDFRLSDAYINAQAAWTINAAQQYRNLSVSVPSGGGYTVPEGFVNSLERKLLAYGGPRSVATVIRTEMGNDLPWPTVDDTSNTGELLGEGGSIGSSVDPTFGAKVLNAYKYSSKPVLISSELLEDSAFNMSQLIGDMLGERLGRITGAHFTTGTNAAQPNGIVTASTLGKTTSSATAIAANELIDLMHSVDPAYRVGATGWMMNDGILQKIRQIVTGTGEYLWQPGLQNGIPDMLLGFPITINQHMTGLTGGAIVTATKTVLFGDFSKYVIRDVAMMRMYRLEELYRANDRTGFVLFTRHDGECIQPAAINHLLQA